MAVTEVRESGVRSRLRHILLHYEILELKSSIMAILWGVWVLANAGVLTTYTPFAFMVQLAPMWLWGLLFLCGGLTQMTFLIGNSWHARRLSTFLAACSWMMLSILFYMAAPFTTAVPTYFAFAMFQGWAYWRLNFERH